MDAALNWIWQGGVVAAGLSVMLRLLVRARANVRYAVCWAALLFVVVLPALPWLWTDARSADTLSSIGSQTLVSMPDAWWTSAEAAAAAWVAWASAYTLRFAFAIAALRRARARGRAFPSDVESALRHWRGVRDSGRRRPALVLSDAVPAAAVLGGGAPVIAVAPSVVAALDPGELDRVLVHEWAHVQRRDDLVGILQIVVRIVAGWHPAVWWIERRLHCEREIACDEMTLAIAGSPKTYAGCLMKLADLGGAQPSALAGPAVLSASGLHARIIRIVSGHAFITSVRSRIIAAGVVSALCAMSCGVGGMKLVEVAALALPLESIGTANASLSAVSALPVPTVASHLWSLRSPRQSAPPAQGARPLPASAAPASPALPGPVPEIASDARIVTDLPPAQAEEDAAQMDPPIERPPAIDVPRGELPAAIVEQSRSPWTAVGDGGIELGRRSKKAAVATAGFFTRFARRVAGSF